MTATHLLLSTWLTLAMTFAWVSGAGVEWKRPKIDETLIEIEQTYATRAYCIGV